MTWKSPTGYVDEAGAWVWPERVYDGNLDSFAYSDPAAPGWSEFLTLKLPATVWCNGISFNAYYSEVENDRIDLDVYKNNAWVDVYEGDYPNRVTTAKSFTAGFVSKFRIRLRDASENPLIRRVYLYEVYYNEEAFSDPQRRLYIDNLPYYHERGSFRRYSTKVFETTVTAGDEFVREEGGFDPDRFEMNVICLSRSEVDALSGSYIKTSPIEGSSSFGKIAFVDNIGQQYEVYFDKMGEIEPIDRNATIFRVPIVLSRTRFP